MYGALAKGQILHGKFITGGQLSGWRRRQLLPEIVAVYAAFGAALQSRRLLEDVLGDQITTPFLFNTLIRAHLLHRLPLDALNLFQRMISVNQKPDNFTFTFAIKACADLELKRGGEQLHCAAVIVGFASDGYVQNSLLSMYLNCGSLHHAKKLFDGMTGKTTISWNTMIAGLCKNGRPAEAAALFDELLETNGAAADCATLVAVLPACGALKDLSRGKQVYFLAREKGWLAHVSVKNALIDMFAKSGSLDEARRVFDEEMGPCDVISWTIMMNGYVLHGRPREALSLYPAMLQSGIKPNSITVISLLSACSGLLFLPHGRALHALSLRRNLSSEVQVETALIDMYSRCGLDPRLSLTVFSAGSKRTATWNAMISSFSRTSFPGEGAELFLLMRRDDVVVDVATFAALLPACSTLADLRQGSSLHAHLVKTGFDRARDLATGLIDMYAKAGNLERARKLFDEMPERDTVAWSAIINGYAAHGRGREAADAFIEMVEGGIEPNEVTFNVLLSSLSRAGLVEAGLDLVQRVPGSSRCYAGVVDLLGRAGLLEEARGLAVMAEGCAMTATWGALLGACAVHGHVPIGEEAAGRLFALEPENTGNYVLLGNIYAAAGRWEDAERVRKRMTEKGLKKITAYSSSL